MEYKEADKTLLPAMKQLWKEVFRDDDTVLREFFTQVYPLAKAFAAVENGALAAMVYALPQALCTREKELSLYYIYGLAASPLFRGRGTAAGLMNFTEKKLAEAGADGLFLKPAEEGLYLYYDRLGYALWNRAEEHPGFLPRGRELPPGEYLRLRQAYLGEKSYILPRPELLLWNWALEWEGGCCIGDRTEGKIRVLELWGEAHPSETPCTYRLPARRGMPDTMYKPLRGEIPAFAGMAFTME